MSEYDYLRGVPRQPDPKQNMLDKLSELAITNKELAEQYYGSLVNAGMLPPLVRTIQPKQSPPMDPLELICARLRLPSMMPGTRITLPNINHISIYLQGTDVAIVFLVKGKTPTIIEDDPGLFPSDSLITQLRLLMADPAK